MEERVEGRVYPFKNTGGGYFCPFEVTVLRRPVKHWCCLFTFLINTTVHIEVVNGLDTNACMMVITRFIARRGEPHTIISDKGTNFVGAAQEFTECFNEWDRDAISERLANGFFWKINPPGAPLFGRFWERLVRSCKKTMLAIFGCRRLTLPVLTTTKCLVEQTLNARPLMPVTDDLDDLEAHTLSHFQLGPPVVIEPLMLDSARYIDCRRMYKVSQAYNQMVWNRWVEDYLLSEICELKKQMTRNAF